MVTFDFWLPWGGGGGRAGKKTGLTHVLLYVSNGGPNLNEELKSYYPMEVPILKLSVSLAFY